MALVFSHSMLEQYDNCPEACRQINILKAYKKTRTVSGGIDVHEAIEKYIAAPERNPLPPGYEHVAGYVASFQRYGKIEVEAKLAVDHLCQPIGFFGQGSKEPWIRGKCDVVVKAPLREERTLDRRTTRKAIIADWKTGKIREKPTQLEREAVLLMANDPTVDEVVGINVWLNYKQTTVDVNKAPYVFTRQEHWPQIWGQLIPKMREIEKRAINEPWERKEGPLCKYCPVQNCTHYRGA